MAKASESPEDGIPPLLGSVVVNLLGLVSLVLLSSTAPILSIATLDLLSSSSDSGKLGFRPSESSSRSEIIASESFGLILILSGASKIRISSSPVVSSCSTMVVSSSLEASSSNSLGLSPPLVPQGIVFYCILIEGSLQA